MTQEKSSQWWQTKENDKVATKPKLWRPLAEAVDGFDLDPAAGCEPTQIADNIYTEENNGLRQPWFGTVWLNPPFSEKTRWYKRLVDQYQNGDVDCVVALATVDLSADWFHNWFSTADVLCYLDGREWYLGQGDSPTFSTQVGVWNHTDAVLDVLSGLGTCVAPINNDQATTLGEFK
jgi:hypothetical protein